MRKLGVMSVWGREDFVMPALDQAKHIVDQVAVTACCMHPWLKKYEDNTEEILREVSRGYPEKVVYVETGRPPADTRWEVVMAQTLNLLISNLDPEPNDIVWLLDVDEFYTEQAIEEINQYISDNPEFVSLRVKARLFGPDSQHYIKHGHTRIHRHFKDRKFIPTSYYAPKISDPPVLLESCPMFHYTLASSWEQKADFWRIECGLPTPEKQQKKVDWCERVYLSYDLEHEEESARLNEKVTGRHGFWFNDNVQENPEPGKYLFEYCGPHPKYIERYDIPVRLGDFRDSFTFSSLRTPLKMLKSKRGLMGAEIGVDRGLNAYSMLSNLDLRLLYLIDPYVPTPDTYREQKYLDATYEGAQQLLKDYQDTTLFIREKSREAHKQIPDCSLDFVYIDGRHTKQATLEDLNLYWNKVKPGGLVCGHDFDRSGVREAVAQFTEERDIIFSTCGQKNWWFIKHRSPEIEYQTALSVLNCEENNSLTAVFLGVSPLDLHLLDSIMSTFPIKDLYMVGNGLDEQFLKSLEAYHCGSFDMDLEIKTYEDLDQLEVPSEIDLLVSDFQGLTNGTFYESLSGGSVVGVPKSGAPLPQITNLFESVGVSLKLESSTDPTFYWFSKEEEENRMVSGGKSEQSSDRRILLIGPWAGELGYEISEYIPRVRKIANSGDFEEVICVVPKGHGALYRDFVDKIVPHEVDFGDDAYKFNTREETRYFTPSDHEADGEMWERYAELHDCQEAFHTMQEKINEVLNRPGVEVLIADPKGDDLLKGEKEPSSYAR